MQRADLLIVGNSGGSNVGWSLQKGANELGLRTLFCDAYEAFVGRRWWKMLKWRLGGHQPTRLRSFSEQVLQTCRQSSPRWLVTTGLAPLDSQALRAIQQIGVIRTNFLTDDPWNRNIRSSWFFRSLREYDRVFTPRQSNIADLLALGCPAVRWLPFGYDPEFCHPTQSVTAVTKSCLDSDVIFVGGADPDRVPYIAALARQGFRLALYGDYWDLSTQTRRATRGHADPETIRRGTVCSKVALCLVRRANRDGHVMRSFEIAATGTCMLAEDTIEHREIFGQEGTAVTYFDSIPLMLSKLRWLLDHDTERRRLAESAYTRVINGRNTYKDRLATMLDEGSKSLPPGYERLSF